MITVAIITYNRPLYLKEAIEAVLSQTFVDFELLICDNGSDIETQKLISYYQDERIVLETNPTNDIEFYNVPFSKLTRPWLLITHDDDIMNADFLERMLPILVNTEIIGLGCNMAYINENSVLTGDFFKKEEDSILEIKSSFVSHYLKGESIPCPTVIMRKDFFTQNKIKMDFNVGRAADQFMWSKVINAGGMLAMYNKSLYKYRIHNTQESNINKGIMECELLIAWFNDTQICSKIERLMLLRKLRNLYYLNSELVGEIDIQCIAFFTTLKYRSFIPVLFFFELKIHGLFHPSQKIKSKLQLLFLRINKIVSN